MAASPPGSPKAPTWRKDAIAAFLLDDPSNDPVEPERASKRAKEAMRRVFIVAPVRSPQHPLSILSHRSPCSYFPVCAMANADRLRLA